MPPPPPKEVMSEEQTSLVKTIQNEVEEKLDKQKQENRDIMDTVTVIVLWHDEKQTASVPLTAEQQQQNDHFDETVSDIYPSIRYLMHSRMFSKTWEDYCVDTMETLLDIDGSTPVMLTC